MKPGVMYHYVVLRGLVGRENFRLYWSPLKKKSSVKCRKVPNFKRKKKFSFLNNHFIAKQIISKKIGQIWRLICWQISLYKQQFEISRDSHIVHTVHTFFKHYQEHDWRPKELNLIHFQKLQKFQWPMLMGL